MKVKRPKNTKGINTTLVKAISHLLGLKTIVGKDEVVGVEEVIYELLVALIEEGFWPCNSLEALENELLIKLPKGNKAILAKHENLGVVLLEANRYVSLFKREKWWL